MTEIHKFPVPWRKRREIELEEAVAILVKNQQVRTLDFYFAIFTLLTVVAVGVTFLSRVMR